MKKSFSVPILPDCFQYCLPRCHSVKFWAFPHKNSILGSWEKRYKTRPTSKQTKYSQQFQIKNSTEEQQTESDILRKCPTLKIFQFIFMPFILGWSLIGPAIENNIGGWWGLRGPFIWKAILAWYGCFDYIPQKLHIIGDGMQKFRIQSSKIQI